MGLIAAGEIIQHVNGDAAARAPVGDPVVAMRMVQPTIAGHRPARLGFVRIGMLPGSGFNPRAPRSPGRRSPDATGPRPVTPVRRAPRPPRAGPCPATGPGRPPSGPG